MRIIFAGTPQFAVPSLQRLIDLHYDVCAVYTQPDRPAGRGQHLQCSPVKTLALANNIPVFQPVSFSNEAELHHLQQFEADVMVVVAYGMLLPQSVLDTPRFGCINGHGSLLPRWRGAAPIQRAVMEGDAQTGVTIMQIVKKLDAGDMLHKAFYTIKSSDTSADVHDALSTLSAEAIEAVLLQIENGSVHAAPQDDALVTYAHKLTKEESPLDWTQSAEILVRKIHGLNPWPVAQTLYNDKPMKIWRASVQHESHSLKMGQVRATHTQFDVAVADGFVRIEELQLPNGKRMSATAFLAAHEVDGLVLGSLRE